MTKRLSAEFF